MLSSYMRKRLKANRLLALVLSGIVDVVFLRKRPYLNRKRLKLRKIKQAVRQQMATVLAMVTARIMPVMDKMRKMV